MTPDLIYDPTLPRPNTPFGLGFKKDGGGEGVFDWSEDNHSLTIPFASLLSLDSQVLR